MSTFADFIAACESNIDNKNARTLPYLKDATVRWLKELSSIRALFMEDTFSFLTVAGTSEYAPGYTGFPVNAMEFHAIYREIGTPPAVTRELLDGPKPIREVRAACYPGTSGGYPAVWAWHHNTMVFAPLVNVVATINGDYFKDATLDEASGDLITSASTTHTNPWFERGEQALRNAVLMDYYASIAKDVEAATLSERLFEKAVGSIQRDVRLKSLHGAQADWHWGG